MLVALGGCGGGGSGSTTTTPAAPSGDWPRFGYDAARANAGPADRAITAATVSLLHRHRIEVPGTVDSSPIYVPSGAGRRLGLFVVTTSYGRTIALDARDGALVWRYAPSGISRWEGSSRITNATPVLSPDGRFVYAASPEGRIHKLGVDGGREVTSGGWPVTVTRDPRHEKIASALNLAGPNVIVTTGGYVGDIPPYQGHVVTIDRRSGRIANVFNTLCSDREGLLVPSRCPASFSAIWARAGAVVEPGSGRLLVATGNGAWNGRTNWGDSVLELSPDASRLLQAWTPRNQAELEAADTDLGSTAPAIVSDGGRRLALQGGKDGILRLLDLTRLNGRTSGPAPVQGGELATAITPGRAALFTAPAVLRSGGRVTAFVADSAGTAAYAVLSQPPTLRRLWQNGRAGTSPILSGDLLYVYDPERGALNVYAAGSGRRLAHLPAAAGHWNSPIVAAGRVALPEGNANDHARTGTLSLYSLR